MKPIFWSLGVFLFPWLGANATYEESVAKRKDCEAHWDQTMQQARQLGPQIAKACDHPNANFVMRHLHALARKECTLSVLRKHNVDTNAFQQSRDYYGAVCSSRWR